MIVLHSSEDMALADVLLPGSQRLVNNGVAHIELFAAKVTRHVEQLVVLQHLQLVVLQHFLLEALGQTKVAEDVLVDIITELVVGSRSAGLEVDLLELFDDLSMGVVVGGAEHALAERLVAVLEYVLDELASVIFGSEEWDGGVGVGGQVEGPAGLLRDGYAGQVGHEVPGEEEGGRDTDLADVLLDCCLASKW